MDTPTTTPIFIAAGTIVLRGDNNRARRRVEWNPVTLIADVYVDATRQDDGGWGYTVSNQAYYAAGGSGVAC